MYAPDLIKHERFWARPGNNWPLDAGFAAELDAYLLAVQPRSIVEVGSGSSTLILARYARATGAKVVSLEHDEKWAAHTLRELQIDGTDQYVDLHLRELVEYVNPGHVGDGSPWYANAGIEQGVDFVLCDGPPEGKGGRAAVLPALKPYLADEWTMLLDDAERPGESVAALAWAVAYGATVEWLPFGKKGAALLTSADRPQDKIDAGNVCVTILTGRRPDRLAELLDSLEASAPGLLDTAQVVALHNDGGSDGGADPVTRAMLERIGASLIVTTSLYGIGRATSLLEASTRKSGAEFWLHLEDDWRLATMRAGWLDDARALLPRRTSLAQVRLRHYSETTMTRHLVTKRPFGWTRGNGAVPHLVSPGAHLTFNPFVARVGSLTPYFPVADEREFMAHVSALGIERSGQLYPGAFVHTGNGSRSLRANGGAP